MEQIYGCREADSPDSGSGDTTQALWNVPALSFRIYSLRLIMPPSQGDWDGLTRFLNLGTVYILGQKILLCGELPRAL